ncbi:unnamed protein product [Phytomonas sp. Hart1]|nr:unnamed protein product [Phytomonas sp. Hart1]|eukprot:CCW71567.1 unnamed protein product [Phytomonas sp. isolate Hart1]
MPHEDKKVCLNFGKLPGISEAEPPPLTDEELSRMTEKSHVASPKFYGCPEYIERHVSTQNTPNCFFPFFFN